MPQEDSEAIIKNTMVRLRLKNPAPRRVARHTPSPFLAPGHPLKPRLHRPTNRQFAEDKASQRYLQTPDPRAYRTHPLATAKVVTIHMEFDEQSDCFVTFVKELHGARKLLELKRLVGIR